MGSHATIGEDGSVAVPEDVRRALGLKAGDRVEFTLMPDGKVQLGPAAAPIRGEETAEKTPGAGLLGLVGSLRGYGPLPPREEIHRLIGEEILKKGRS
ncbi:AbrB/MazE/SpoVT family DNA-binding domain-containing protein [Salinarimonas rosea]|uniref:AbrB/MazE/SpoVT family DNA-binding domain-containing protein n=1 Tax=Salinarimonas rosea TaxID=552063 RepID=UPI000407241D|nr:AbrB/MazE/SpoVT family DNA-binding domain-containing protein [Salinarimonas rosea]